MKCLIYGIKVCTFNSEIKQIQEKKLKIKQLKT